MVAQRVCKIENCGKPYCAKGYCKTHYTLYITNRGRPPRYRLDIKGHRYGRLVVERWERSGGKTGWLCRCDCGETRLLTRCQLRKHEVKSCGCLRRERARTHGGTGTKAYRTWQAMKARCAHPNNPKFKHYGGRGIKVCERWINSFENFLADMGAPPDGKSLDRIDVNGNYEPSNCRWATAMEQSMNRRNTVSLESYRTIKQLSDGGMKKLEIAQKLGLPVTTVGNRLAKARLLWANALPLDSTG